MLQIDEIGPLRSAVSRMIECLFRIRIVLNAKGPPTRYKEQQTNMKSGERLFSEFRIDTCQLGCYAPFRGSSLRHVEVDLTGMAV